MDSNTLTRTLVDLGLTEKEARAYLALLSLGPTTILKVAQTAGIKRTTIYSLVEALKQRGLVSVEVRGFKKLFAAEDPSRLKYLLELQRERLNTPIITKELYDRAQEQLTRSEITRNDREFAFTKLITCGLCGSGITASEKWKHQKNGNTHRYVYYGCTKARDKDCKCGYIKEEEIIEQVLQILDTLDINELGIKQKFKDEIARYNKFRKIALGKGREKNDEPDAFDARSYAAYLLAEGLISEKRELLSNLKSKLILISRLISLVKEET